MQRPWYCDHRGSLSHHFTWAASLHVQGGHTFARPRSEGAAVPGYKRVAAYQTGGERRWCNSRASSKVRPLTDLSPPSTSPGKSSLQTDLSLRLDGTAAPRNAPKSAALAIACDPWSHPSRESSSDRIKVTEMLSLTTTAKVDPQSSSSASCFSPAVVKETPQSTGMSSEGNHADHTDLEDRDTHRDFMPRPADTINGKTNTIRDVETLQKASATRQALSAGVMPAPTRSTQLANESEETTTRPRAACGRDPTIISGEGPFYHNAVDTREPIGHQEPETRGDSVEKLQRSGLHNIGSSIGGTVSVEVVLPRIEQSKGVENRRIRPGPTTKGRTSIVRVQAGNHNTRCTNGRPRQEQQVDRVPDDVDGPTSCIASRLPETTFAGALGTREERLNADEPSDSGGKRMRGHDDADRESTAQPILQPPVGVQGHFNLESWGKSRSSLDSALRGRALAGNSRSRAPSLSRPCTPAVVPGRQPFGATHPLSPTSLDSPPRRHRNSNWGEEGEPLTLEEEECSRDVVPYVVSGIVLGWKISTRGRKKSLEDSLKASDYSEHHLIPVYGFRCADATDGVAPRERRLELKRLKIRAMAAEREVLKRRTRAHERTGGGAFARTVSRRALTRADWIQKMGDVQDARKENLRRGSSPEVVRMYRKHVKDRIHCVCLHKRAERGLPLRRPTRICAVTSRADLVRARQSLKNRPLQKDSGASKGDRFIGELAQEPYLMLVRARRRLDLQQDCSVAPFCGECLGGCKGACSPGSRG